MAIQDFFDASLAVIPLKGKVPFVNDWYNVDFEPDIKKYVWESIGLKCGKASKIIALDFDNEDPFINKTIQRALPPIYSGKIGKRERLPTMFFKYNEEISQDLRNLKVQLLSTGKQTVLPPSKHPDRDYSYEWVGKSLLEIDIDDLPDLTKETWESLVKLDQQLEGTYISKEATGRNDRLKAQVVAALSNGKGVDEIVKEIIEYDKNNHSPPLFEDKTEANMKGNVYQNALGFVCRIVSSTLKNSKIEIVEPSNSIIIDLKNYSDKKDFIKLPKLVGLGNDLFHEFYDNASIPRTQFAFQQTLLILSILINNRFLFKGTGANLYLYGVGPSASGKDYPLKRAQKLILESNLEKLIGSSSPTSETILLKMLDESRVMLCWINEAEKTLKTIANPKTNFGLIESLTDLYDGSGKDYLPKGIMTKDGKIDKFGKIFSPFVNVCMMSTLSAFNDNVRPSMFDTGFLSRFEIFFEDRFKVQKYIEDYNPPIDSNFTSYISQIGACGPIIDNSSTRITIPYLKESNSSIKTYKDIFNVVVHEIKEAQGSQFQGVLSRKMLKINKYISLHHLMLNPLNPLDVSVCSESIEWAYEAVTAIFNNMLLVLPTEVHQNDYDKMLFAVFNNVKRLNNSDRPATKSSIANGIQWIPSKKRSEILNDLLEQGKLTLNKENKQYFVY